MALSNGGGQACGTAVCIVHLPPQVRPPSYSLRFAAGPVGAGGRPMSNAGSVRLQITPIWHVQLSVSARRRQNATAWPQAPRSEAQGSAPRTLARMGERD